MNEVTSIKRIFPVGDIRVDGQLSEEGLSEAVARIAGLIVEMFVELGWPMARVDIGRSRRSSHLISTTATSAQVGPRVRDAITHNGDRGEIEVTLSGRIPGWV